MLSRRVLLRAGAGLALATTAATAVPADVFGAGTVDWQRLRTMIKGDVVLPTDSGYALARQMAFAQYDSISPQAVLYCETAQDVRDCVRFAQDNELSVRVRSGGHNFAGWSTGDGVVIDVSRINAVSAGPATVSLGPGTQSVDALTALSADNRQIVTGTCPNVCAGGYLSGGGIGFQTRKFGVGSDRLVTAGVVLADGRIVTCSATREPDLFWALRGGGGGNFGIVVGLEVRPIQAPTMVFFSTVWNWEDAQRLVPAWQEWTRHGSTNIGSQLLVALTDAAPGATPIVIVQGGYLGPRTECTAALAELSALAGSSPVDTVELDLPYHDAMMQVYGCGQVTVPECHRVPTGALARVGFEYGRTRLFSRPLAGSALDAVLAAYDGDRRTGQSRYLNLIALGGVANEVGRTDTAYVHRDTEFLLAFAAVMNSGTPPADDVAAATEWADGGFATMDPFSNHEAYVNYCDPALADWRHGYYAENYPRLLRVKHAYDPHDFFRHPQSIGS